MQLQTMLCCTYNIQIMYTLRVSVHIVSSTKTDGRRDGAVDVVIVLLARRSGVRILSRTRGLSVLQNVHTSCGPHPASYSMDTRVPSRVEGGLNRPGREVYSSPPSDAEIVCLHSVDRVSFTKVGSSWSFIRYEMWWWTFNMRCDGELSVWDVMVNCQYEMW
jgi:hypothetical protein